MNVVSFSAEKFCGVEHDLPETAPSGGSRCNNFCNFSGMRADMVRIACTQKTRDPDAIPAAGGNIQRGLVYAALTCGFGKALREP